MRARSMLVVSTIVVACCLAPPALATRSDWDPDDRPGKLDLRWGGLFVEDRGTVRLGISLWNRVYPRHLRSEEDRLTIAFPYHDLGGRIRPTPTGWSLWLSYQGAYWDRRLKVDHPKPRLFRVWIDADLLVDDAGNTYEVQVSSEETVRGRAYRDRIGSLRL